MNSVKIPLSQIVKTVYTTKGHKIELVDVKIQCGMGDCLCIFGINRSDDDKEKGLVTIDLCDHHKEIQ